MSSQIIEIPPKTEEIAQSERNIVQQPEIQPQQVPYRLLKQHWLTISRPQYKRTCGISSIVSIWNHQFSRLGLGNRDPICVEQAMLKLNLIGKGSIEEGMRKRFKKTAELAQKAQNSTNNTSEVSNQSEFNDKTLYEYIDSVDFGCFTGNDTLLKWYRLLCRIYGGSGRSYYFYKVNSERSLHKQEKQARRGLVQGMNKENMCFIYHAHDHYFCPLGYEFVPKEESASETFSTSQLGQEGSQLFVMVGESSKMFPGIHVFKWEEIQLDLTTYWPQYFNIRRRKQGVITRAGKENDPPSTSTINCIMAFQKVKD